MSTAKERVIEELTQLDLKIVSLVNALDANSYGNLAISKEQVLLLRNQVLAMQLYSNILKDRLSIWEGD